MFTGIHPIRLGLLTHATNIKKQHLRHHSKFTFISKFLLENGYQTYAVDWFGRWHQRGFQFCSSRLNKGSPNKKPFINQPKLLKTMIAADIFLAKLTKEVISLIFIHRFTKQKFLYDKANLVTDKAVSFVKQAMKKSNHFTFISTIGIRILPILDQII